MTRGFLSTDLPNPFSRERGMLCACRERVYLDKDSPTLPYPWRNVSDGALHTCGDEPATDESDAWDYSRSYIYRGIE